VNDRASGMCNEAIECANRGWPVLPVWGVHDGRCDCPDPACQHPGKHPQGRLAPHGLKDATCAGDVICSWFSDGLLVNIGIRTGPESVIVLDIDPKNGGDIASLGNLPDTAIVETGGGGWHVYFVYPKGWDIRNSASKFAPGVDIRGAGGYVLVPPSRHVSGKEYRWLRDPRGGIAELPASILARLTGEFDRAHPSPVTEEITEETEDPNIASVSSVTGVSSVIKVSSVIASSVIEVSFDRKTRQVIEQAIVATLPTGTGQRDRCVFRLCQRLKAIPELRACTFAQLKPVVREWHARAYPKIGTKPFDNSWSDFAYAWPNVKWPMGAQVEVAVQRARQDTGNPPEAANYEDPRIRLLLRICWQLQQLNPERLFYLAVRKAGELVGIPYPQIGKVYAMFMADGILAIVHPHTGPYATRYRLLEKEHGMKLEQNPPQHDPTDKQPTPPADGGSALDEQAEAAAMIEEERSFTADGERAQPQWD